jgi:hypothetical protein
MICITHVHHEQSYYFLHFHLNTVTGHCEILFYFHFWELFTQQYFHLTWYWNQPAVYVLIMQHIKYLLCRVFMMYIIHLVSGPLSILWYSILNTALHMWDLSPATCEWKGAATPLLALRFLGPKPALGVSRRDLTKEAQSLVGQPARGSMARSWW